MSRRESGSLNDFVKNKKEKKGLLSLFKRKKDHEKSYVIHTNLEEPIPRNRLHSPKPSSASTSPSLEKSSPRNTVIKCSSAVEGNKEKKTMSRFELVKRNSLKDSDFVKEQLSIIENASRLSVEALKNSYVDSLKSMSEEELYGFIAQIPMRLTTKEREYLDVLEAALEVSDYTNCVDVAKSDYVYFGFYSKTDIETSLRDKTKLIELQHREFKRILFGMMMVNNINECQKIMKDKQLQETFLQECFEVGRRYKISNPSKMMDTYQKMMHMLQDASIYNPSFIGPEFMNQRKWKKIYTVGRAMKKMDIHISSIMKAIRLGDGGMEMDEILTRYGEEGVRLIYSIRDGIEASSKTCGVVFGMLKQLERFREEKTGHSLAIYWGKDGSHLTHGHDEHFIYVHQSLMLWWNVSRQMPLLWTLNDKDFLSTRPYQLMSTGQGLQRMQRCPSVSDAMSKILEQTKSQFCNGVEWRGLSVIHFADRDVPNSLFFIDKYSQIPWILSPVLRTSKNMFTHRELKRVPTFFDTVSSRNWGRIILQHFFQHAFDGSGSDGGSCIDGRLTSAWNWCSMIDKYIYYPLFLLCDFDGFDNFSKK